MDVFTARLWGYTPRVAADQLARMLKDPTANPPAEVPIA